ncbi:MAG: Endonuclease [Myxococcaceae bacterium]|nr:Endonuclease [Myxococcaceae bacterium]MEA2749039.1 endonuclease [Myxococcales bacterium]
MAAKKTVGAKRAERVGKTVARAVKTAAVRVRQTVAPKKKMAPPVETLDRLHAMHPDAHCELDHRNAFELLCATVLSAQTTDVNVNKATPKLFAAYPDAKALAKAEQLDVEPLVATLGFFRQKSKSLIGLAKAIVAQHGGEVPRTMEELIKLPGVGRKTANVVMGVMWNAPDGVVVDTHVQRISQRLGWTRNTDPVKIEQDLCKLLPRERWNITSHVLIFHGRRICFARKPDCEKCGISDVCPSAFRADKVGRKPPRVARLPRV